MEVETALILVNNAISEIKNTLEATHSRITEAEDRISEFEDRMVEINESERINEKRIKRNEHNLRDLQDSRLWSVHLPSWSAECQTPQEA